MSISRREFLKLAGAGAGGLAGMMVEQRVAKAARAAELLGGGMGPELESQRRGLEGWRKAWLESGRYPWLAGSEAMVYGDATGDQAAALAFPFWARRHSMADRVCLPPINGRGIDYEGAPANPKWLTEQQGPVILKEREKMDGEDLGIWYQGGFWVMRRGELLDKRPLYLMDLETKKWQTIAGLPESLSQVLTIEESQLSRFMPMLLGAERAMVEGRALDYQVGRILVRESFGELPFDSRDFSIHDYFDRKKNMVDAGTSFTNIRTNGRVLHMVGSVFQVVSDDYKGGLILHFAYDSRALESTLSSIRPEAYQENLRPEVVLERLNKRGSSELLVRIFVDSGSKRESVVAKDGYESIEGMLMKNERKLGFTALMEEWFLEGRGKFKAEWASSLESIVIPSFLITLYE